VLTEETIYVILVTFFCFQGKRTKGASLGFTSFKQVKGKCDHCHSWLRYGSKQVEHSIIESKQMLKSLQPDYWNEFDAEVVQLELDKPELRRCENKIYLDKFIAYVQAAKEIRDGNLGTIRPALTPELLMALDTNEFLIAAEMEKHKPRVQSISTHVSLKITVDESYAACWERPKPNHLYCVWDHMAMIQDRKIYKYMKLRAYET